MKKLMVLFVLILMPISIKANVLCGDGTTSEKCSVCGHGCCSYHGGCVGPIEEKEEEPTINEPVINEPVVSEPEPEVIAPVVEPPVITNNKTITKQVIKEEPVVLEDNSIEVSEEISEEVQSQEVISKEEPTSKEEKSSENDDTAIFWGLAFLYVVLGTIASAILIPFFIIRNVILKKK